MNPKNDRTQSGQSRPTLSPARPRRFRIEKLEQRIAPAKGGKGTNHCTGLGCHCGPGPC